MTAWQIRIIEDDMNGSDRKQVVAAGQAGSLNPVPMWLNATTSPAMHLMPGFVPDAPYCMPACDQ